MLCSKAGKQTGTVAAIDLNPDSQFACGHRRIRSLHHPRGTLRWAALRNRKLRSGHLASSDRNLRKHWKPCGAKLSCFCAGGHDRSGSAKVNVFDSPVHLFLPFDAIRWQRSESPAGWTVRYLNRGICRCRHS